MFSKIQSGGVESIFQAYASEVQAVHGTYMNNELYVADKTPITGISNLQTHACAPLRLAQKMSLSSSGSTSFTLGLRFSRNVSSKLAD